MKIPNIDFLFKPRSIAIIGASRDQTKVGYKIWENILNGGYKGKVFLINKNGGKINEESVYQNVLEIKEDIDLAIITIPALSVFEAVKDCGRKKIKFIIIVASGFSEIGNIEEEEKIAEFAKKEGVRILGPNVFGLYSSAVFLNATFGANIEVKPGNLAIISQSGALGIALMGKTQTENIGLSSIVFEGNKSDLSEKDLLPYFLKDEKTKVIFIYLEGLCDGRELLSVLRQTTSKKPVVILKSGLSDKGKIATSSHTGSLAGEAEVFAGMMKQAGVIQVKTLSQAINLSQFLINAPRPKGENTVIITNGGGMGVLATDACDKLGVKVYDDRQKLKEIFSSIAPGFGSLINPIDITGMATEQDYQKALEACLADSEIHSIICLGCETAVLDNQKLAKVFKDVYKKAKKPIVFSFVGGNDIEQKLLSLRKEGIPIFGEIYDAVSCLGGLYQYWRNCNLLEPKFPNFDLDVLQDNILSLLRRRETRKILELLEIPIAKGGIIKDEFGAVETARKIGYPVVMKIADPKILHKTEKDGVVLNISDEKQVIDVYREFERRGQKIIEVAEMVKGGTEIIVGAKKDNEFGTVVMVGLGGIYAEVFKDVAFRVFPLSLNEAIEMIKQLKCFPLLVGIRGEKEKDINSLAEVVLKLGALVDKFPQISEIEINPLAVFEKGVKALDIKIIKNDNR